MSAGLINDSESQHRRSSIPATGTWLTQISITFAAFALGIVLYWPSLSGPKLFDDEVMLNDGVGTQSFVETINSLNWLRPETRPLVHLTFDLETLAFGNTMSAHRVGNVLVHALAAMALVGLIRRSRGLILSERSANASVVHDHIPFAVAILWFVHPLQTSAVAYVAQRCESLMGLFFFLYLRCLVELVATKKNVLIIAATAAFGLGLLSKTIMVTAPLVGLLLDRGFFAASWREALRRQWSLMLVPVAGSIAAIGLLLPGILEGQANVGFGGDAPPVGLHLAAQSKVIWFYAIQCIWPLWLSVDHALRPPQFASEYFGWILATTLLLIISIELCWRQKWNAGFFVLAPLCVLATTSSIIPTADLWVDHRMYVPLAAIVTVFVLGLQSLLTRLHGPLQSKRVFSILVGVFCILLAARTWVRASDYRSGIQIWRSAIAENPDNDRAIQNLIDATREESPELSIMPVLKQALKTAEANSIVPTVVFGRMGEQFAQAGDSIQAIKVLRQAIRLDDRHFFSGYRGARRHSERFGMHVNMGLALASQGQFPAAQEQINQAFRYGDTADARALCGSLSVQVGEIAEARLHFQRALELRPGWKDVESDLERLRQLQ